MRRSRDSSKLLLISAAVALILSIPHVAHAKDLPQALHFTINDQAGAPFTEADLARKPTVIHFGFTHCPVICPTTLYEVAGHMQALGELAERINFVFVTVDPERDAPAYLKTYIESFDSRIIGLSGTQSETSKLAAAVGAHYARIESANGDYTMDHSVAGFLIVPGRSTVEEVYMGAGAKSAHVMSRLRDLAGNASRTLGQAPAGTAVK